MNKNKKRPLILLIVFSLLLSTVATAFAEGKNSSPGRYRISIPEDKKLIFRELPDSNSKVLDHLYNGEAVEVVEVVGSWAKARQNGQDGWFALQYAELQKAYDCARLIADISSADCTAVDFDVLSGEGVSGVLLRLAVSANNAEIVAEDSNLIRFYRAAVNAGLDVGVYVSSSAVTRDQIQKECDRALDIVKDERLTFTLPVFYRPSSAVLLEASSEQNTALAKAFCRQMEENGLASGVFLPVDCTSANLNFDELGDYAHWIADYADYCNFTKTYDLWQFEEAVSYAGATGEIGLSYMFFDVTSPSADEPSDPSAAPSETPTEKTTEPTTFIPPEPTTEETEPSGHVHTAGEFVETKAASCTSGGELSAFCVDCGKLLAIRSTEPTGHRVGAWVVQKAPTADEDGLAVADCTVCGKRVREHLIDATSDAHIHTPGDWEKADIFADGSLSTGQTAPREEGTTAQDGSTGAVSEPFVCTADSERVLYCVDCGKLLYRVLGEPEAHTPAEGPVVLPADCESDGHERVVCTVCGTVLTDEITPAYGHTVEKWETVRQPGDGESGEARGVCTRCGKTVTMEIPTGTARGDVNGDGVVNSIDARLVLRHAARLALLTAEASLRAEVSGDGIVNSSDARLILRAAARLEIL